MNWDGVFFGSSTGNTEEVAELIANSLNTDLHDIGSPDAIKLIKDSNNIVIGTSTWGDGDLQDDWDDIMSEFQDIDFSGKTVALFGLGDQEGYPETFVDAMREIYDVVLERGAKVVGETSLDGYDFEESIAVVDGKFVGLALDQDNQEDLTESRIEAWCSNLSS